MEYFLVLLGRFSSIINIDTDNVLVCKGTQIIRGRRKKLTDFRRCRKLERKNFRIQQNTHIGFSSVVLFT